MLAVLARAQPLDFVSSFFYEIVIALFFSSVNLLKHVFQFLLRWWLGAEVTDNSLSHLVTLAFTFHEVIIYFLTSMLCSHKWHLTLHWYCSAYERECQDEQESILASIGDLGQRS